ncbi:ABC transporter permease, partial [Pseudomonas monteilii]|nr:ABC transporter permease [Pseudomonas monteilii]
MSQEQIDLLRQRYGLDQPFLVQYFLWIRNVLTGNLGFSLVSQSSISQELATRIPNTMRLVIPAYLTALLLAIILGLLAAANKGKIWDRIIDAVASLGIAVPTFWFAMILIYVFGYLLNMFPIIGMYTVGKEGDFGDFLQHF